MSQHNPDPVALTRRQARELGTLGPRSKPRAPKASKRQKAARKASSTFVSLIAMTFAAALVVAVSVPASAFMSDAAPVSLVTQTTERPGQSVVVSTDATASPVSRDAFSSMSYAELLRQQYANEGKYVATTGAIRWPFPYTVKITDGFGYRAAGSPGEAFHNGLDFVPGEGTPIYAIADGIVTKHDRDWSFGNVVVLKHDVNGMQFDSLYAHMQDASSPLKVGDVVKVGDFIGLVGDTGSSYGAHLHLEIHINNVPVDPFAWLQLNAL